MHAAAQGNSTIGIPKNVGEEFAKGDPGGKLPMTKKNRTAAEKRKALYKSEK